MKSTEIDPLKSADVALKEHKFAMKYKPKICTECYVYYVEPGAKMCEGCEAYKEHQQ